MGKLVLFELGDGNFDCGFPVTMQIGDEGKPPALEIRGKLPPNHAIWQQYQRWRETYVSLESYYRLSVKADGQPSSGSFQSDCHQATQQLQSMLEVWLSADSLRTVRERFIARVQQSDDVRILIQTDDTKLQHIPWHLWSLFAAYSRAEVAVTPSNFDVAIQKPALKSRLRVLAIVGNSTGIDTQADVAVLKRLLSSADMKVLSQPQPHELTEQLWDRRGWDILYFAGHSASEMDSDNAWIEINQTDTITIPDLKRSLRTAIENGLKLAIFNSCDGLGLARALADLNIPQVIVMRELVPDPVANAFLRYFLGAFVRGEPLYYAVKEARGKLEGLQSKFPCATWLPVIYQISPDVPHNLRDWVKKRDHSLRLSVALTTSLLVGGLVVGTRLLGLWQWADLQAYDHLLRLRKADGFDPRIFVVRLTLDDQDSENKTALKSETWFALFSKLKQAQTIGLDVYRGGLQGKEREVWSSFFKKNPELNIYGVCERPNNFRPDGEPLSPGLDKNKKFGFSNVSVDWEVDRALRRQNMSKSLDATVTKNLQKHLAVCPTEYALSFALAKSYLSTISKQYTTKAVGQEWQLGAVIFNHLQVHSGGYQTLQPNGYEILLNYRTPLEVGESATVKEVIKNYDPAYFKNKIVLIGIDNYHEDRYLTPYQRDVAGVFIHAQMLSALLDIGTGERSQIWFFSTAIEAIWIVGWSLAGGLLVWCVRSPLLLVISGGALLGLLYGGCFFLLQDYSGWIPLLPPTVAFVLTTGSLAIYGAVQEKQL